MSRYSSPKRFRPVSVSVVRITHIASTTFCHSASLILWMAFRTRLGPPDGVCERAQRLGNFKVWVGDLVDRTQHACRVTSAQQAEIDTPIEGYPEPCFCEYFASDENPEPCTSQEKEDCQARELPRARPSLSLPSPNGTSGANLRRERTRTRARLLCAGCARGVDGGADEIVDSKLRVAVARQVQIDLVSRA